VLEGATDGNLCIVDSWPGQMRTVYGDHERFIQTYFSTYKASTSPVTAAAATRTAITGSPAAWMT
jgi:acyl-coenzyme A synthetase/AMP-(fatty) acid ligase